MKVVFIRHLQTPGNEKRQYIGSTDEDLSERAAAQFRKMCRPDGVTEIRVISHTPYPPVQYVIASPLRRCVRTAELIWPGREIFTDPALRECDFGAYEGKTYEELKHEPEYIRFLESGGRTAFPGGEDQTAFRRRCAEGVKRWVRRLLEKDAGSAAFVVHGGTIMAALEELAETSSRNSGQAGEESAAGGTADPDGDFYRWQAENGCGYTAEALREDWENGRMILRNIKKLEMN